MNSDVLNGLLDNLVRNRVAVIRSLKPAQIDRYLHLQEHLHATNVAGDRDYQRIFNAFYRVQRRTESWYGAYYGLLEAEKRNQALSFEDVLRRLYAQTGRVEPSFASKLVATVRPEMPVYDKFVRENLALRIPGQYRAPDARIRGFVVTYDELQRTMSRLVRSEQFQVLKATFDEVHPAYVHFTGTKKLDLLLWQYRRGDTT